MAATKPLAKVATKVAHRALPKAGAQKTSQTVVLKTAEARAKRKAEIATNVKQAKDKLGELTVHDTILRNKLKELRKKYNDGANPQFKEELDALKIEVDESGTKLMGSQTDLNYAIQEKDEIDKMDVDTASLFVEEGDNSSDGPSSSSHPA